jgi:hypothetical protein
MRRPEKKLIDMKYHTSLCPTLVEKRALFPVGNGL